MTVKRVDLTANQAKLWNDTRAAISFTCPAFIHVFYQLMNKAGSDHIAVFTEDVPIAATDGECMLLNPKTFFKYNLKERVFICVHEIMHCIWNHCALMHQFHTRGKVAYADGTTLPYNQELMNVAADYVINDCLISCDNPTIGQFNKDWLHDKSIAVGTDSAIDAYKKVYKHTKGGKGGGGGGVKGKGFDDHLKPGTSRGKDPQTAVSERNEGQWKAEVAAGMAAAKAMGKLPAAIERFLGEILEPKVEWREHIRSEISRRVGTGTYDWRKPDRRFIVRDIYAPARSGFGCGTVVVGADTSGSISYGKLPDGRPATGDMFLAEVAGILDDLNPERVILIWCDAAVNRVDELEDVEDLNVIRSKKAPGGGGTSFIPVFDEIEQMGVNPDALVYLTDLYGLFPQQEPSFPVIWGSISPPDAVKVPFGTVVNIPQQVA